MLATLFAWGRQGTAARIEGCISVACELASLVSYCEEGSLQPIQVPPRCGQRSLPERRRTALTHSLPEPAIRQLAQIQSWQ